MSSRFAGSNPAIRRGITAFLASAVVTVAVLAAAGLLNAAKVLPTQVSARASSDQPSHQLGRRPIPQSASALSQDLYIPIVDPIFDPPPPRCITPTQGLSHWWPLDETSGVTASDIMSGWNAEANPGEIGDAGPTSVAGQVGSALEFDGFSTFLSVPDTAGMLSFGASNANFAIDAWIRVDPSDKMGIRPILDKRVQTADGIRGYSFSLTNGRLSFQMADAAGGSTKCDQGPPSSITSCTNYVSPDDIADGNWHFVAVTIQRTPSPEVTLYVDGAAVLTGVARQGAATSDVPLLIGRGYPIVISAPSFKGTIDELEIFSRAIGAGDVLAIWNAGSAGKCRPVPVAKPCCQFGLRLYNTLPDTIERIVVVPKNTQAIEGMYSDEDSEDWTVSKSSSGEYTIQAASALIPADSLYVIDADFAIKIDPKASPTSVTIRWLKSDGTVVKEDEVTLECISDSKLDQEETSSNWLTARQRLSGVADDVIFSGAEPEECEDFDEEELIVGEWPVDKTFQCQGNTNYLVLKGKDSDSKDSNGNSVSYTYDWIVKADDGSESGYVGKDVSHPLPAGNYTVAVTLRQTKTVTTIDKQGKKDTTSTPAEWETDIPICISTADFQAAKAVALPCDGLTLKGFSVKFTRSDNYTCPGSTFEWDFGDGSVKDTATLSPEHPYAATTKTYTARLKVKDSIVDSCPQEKTAQVPISTVCDPTFRMVYQLCSIDFNDDVEYKIGVKFYNDSTTFCNTKYQWNFGDGTPVIADLPAKSFDHTFIVKGNKINHGQPIGDVVLTMTDGTYCPTSPVKSVKLEFKSTFVRLKVVVCPDRDTWFVADTTSDDVEWDLAGTGDTCEKRAKEASTNNEKRFSCSLKEGTFKASVTALEHVNGDLVISTCTGTQSFNVKAECCEKLTYRDKRTVDFNGTKYQIKFMQKLAARLIGNTGAKIKAKTKVRVERKSEIGKLKFWRFAKLAASLVSVEIVDTLRHKGLLEGEECDCIEPTLHNPSPVVRTKRSVAVQKINVQTAGVHLNDEVKSIHHVIYGGLDWTITATKAKGSLCDVTDQDGGKVEVKKCKK